jgi:hypothetical protein
VSRELPDIGPEQIVLGSLLSSPSSIKRIREILEAGDFFRPAHGLIYEAICTQDTAWLPTDPVAVCDLLVRNGEISRMGGAPYLHTLIASVPVAANAMYYARIVKDRAVLRRAEMTGLRLVQRATAPDADPAEVVTRAEADVAELAHGFQPAGAEVVDVEAFTTLDLPYGEPVIPGLLHQQERVIFVAGEGVGKSTNAFQCAVMTAAGLHPYSWELVPPQRTLIVDLENPSASVQRRLRMLLRHASDVPGWDPGRCHVWSRPGGIDLLSAADQRMLLTVISRADPALICAGPLYKMSVDRGERAEQLYSSVTAFWDRVREHHGCALWLEAHAPLGQGGTRDMRPFGSGIWSRWPEFGLSFVWSRDEGDPRGTVNVGTFRGHREDRVWPVKLRPASPWPWSGVYPAGTFGIRREVLWRTSRGRGLRRYRPAR